MKKTLDTIKRTAVILCLLLLSGFINKVKAQTKITILGTVHQPTDKINSENIFQVLLQLNPDVILMELDSSLMDDKGKFLFDLSELEYKASLRFTKVKSVIFRRFDFEGRNNFYQSNNTFANEANSFKSLDSLYKANGLDSIGKYIYKNYLAVNKVVESIGYNYSIESLNTSVTDQLVALRQKLLYKDMTEVFRNTALLQQHFNFYKSNADFWRFRNETMTNNILNFVKEFNGKNIVVLTGFYHRYYLRQLISQNLDKHNIILNDLY